MKKGPLILIILLLLILIFIGGVHYGKRVEQTNKKISAVLSLTPPVSPTAEPSEIISYQSYLHEDCGISFLYPTTMTVEKESSQEATLLNATQTEKILISCDESYELSLPENMASESAKLGNRTITTYRTDNTIAFTLPQPYTGDTLTISISENLFALLQETLEFTR